MKKIIITIMIFLVSITSNTIAEELSPDKALIKEIEVMEAILNKTLGENTKGVPGYIMGDTNYISARGVYLPGNGVVFDVPYLAYQPGYEGPADNPGETYGTSGWGGTPYWSGKEDAKPEVLIREIRDSIVTFYTKYTPSVSELKPDEKFTVVMNLAGLAAKFYKKKNPFPMQILSTLSMKDIESFKKNKISEEEFRNCIVINEVDSINEDVAIFSRIIQTSFAQMNEGEGFAYQGDVVSISLPGHGVLFMLDPDIWVKSIEMVINDIKEMRESAYTGEFDKLGNPIINNDILNKKSKYPKTAMGFEIDSTKKYTEKLIEITSKYGQTLSSVGPDGYVEIALVFNMEVISSRPFSARIIRVQKSDIDDFHKGKIDFEAFRKQVTIFSY